MPHGITQCYLPPGRGDIPALTPAEAGTRLSDPGGMQGWVDLVGLLHTRPKTVTHPCNNRARRALTSFMRWTPLTTTPRRQPIPSVLLGHCEVCVSLYIESWAAANAHTPVKLSRQACMLCCHLLWLNWTFSVLLHNLWALFFVYPIIYCIIIWFLYVLFRWLQKRTMGSRYLSVFTASFAWWSTVQLWCCQRSIGCMKTSACFQTTTSMAAFWQPICEYSNDSYFSHT